MPLVGSFLILYLLSVGAVAIIIFLLHLQQKMCKSGPVVIRKSKNYLQMNLK